MGELSGGSLLTGGCFIMSCGLKFERLLPCDFRRRRVRFYQVQVAAVETEHNLARRRLEYRALSADGP